MFNKNRKTQQKQIDELQEKVAELASEISKTKRITKYSKEDKVNLNLDCQMVPRNPYSGVYDEVWNLFIYIKNEEYVITLRELGNCYISDYSLYVENGLAYFTCKAQRGKGSKYKYNFVIDYSKCNYVVANAQTIKCETSGENKEDGK